MNQLALKKGIQGEDSRKDFTDNNIISFTATSKQPSEEPLPVKVLWRWFKQLLQYFEVNEQLKGKVEEPPDEEIVIEMDKKQSIKTPAFQEKKPELATANQKEEEDTDIEKV